MNETKAQLEKIFRPEALEPLITNVRGEGIFYQPLSLKISFFAILAISMLFIMFAALIEFKDAENVQGYLVPAEGEVKIYGQRGGRFKEIMVANGEHVQAGAILAEVILPEFNRFGVQVAATISSTLDGQSELYQAQMELFKANQERREELNLRRLQNLDQRKALLHSQLQLQEEEVTLSNNAFQAKQKLFETHLISKSELDVAHSNHIGIQRQRNQIQIELQMIDSEIDNVEFELREIQDALGQRQLATSITQAELDQERQALGAANTYFVTAPASGVVANQIFAEGDAVRPSIPLLSLLPDSSTLKARFLVPSSAIGKVTVGQQLFLTFDAYPNERYGAFQSRVASVSDAAVDPREFEFPIDTSEPVFIVEAELNVERLSQDPAIHLKAGMSLRADLVIDERTLLSRLFQSVERIGSTAL